MRKKLLILGATSETSKMVDKAESMGIETYVVDPFDNAQAKKRASHSILLDCFDVDGICKIIKEENIDGILPGCADILIPVYEEVCFRTGLKCYVNKEIVSYFNNKRGLKDILKRFGLPVVNEYTYEEVSNPSFANFPIFIKPVDNNSSKGMSVVIDAKDIEKAYQKALAYSRSNSVLIEDNKQCDDFYVGYFFQDGNVAVTFTGDRYVNSEQKDVGTITSGIVYPSKYEKLYFDTTHEKMLAIFKYLNMRNGILSIQGFVEDGKIMFYDPALRITGGQEYLLSKHFYGLDILEALVNFALSGKMGSEELYKKCDASFLGKYGCNLAFSVKACTIGKITGMDFAREHSNVINITQEHKEGDVIDKIGTAQQNFARMHIVAQNKRELIDVISALQEEIVAYDDKGNNVMLQGMDASQI